MGCGSFSARSYADYSTSVGKTYDSDTGRVSGQVFTSRSIDESLDPKLFKIRECCNNDEHPNTIPIILGLDVTGSMGDACKETAEALGVIITNLYKKYKDVEFCVMGIGDLAYDRGPVQMSQFESDVRIAEALDKIWMEHGGGGNDYESYTVAWYMGLKRTMLDCWKQGRKGIIITMGDEPLNPYLPFRKLNAAVKATEQADIETKDLYTAVTEKFDVFHISVDDPADEYYNNASHIDSTFGKLLGHRHKVATLQTLSRAIEECISESIGEGTVQNISETADSDGGTTKVNENGEVYW